MGAAAYFVDRPWVRHFPVNGLVPYKGQVVPILNRRRTGREVHYVIHTRAPDGALEMHFEVTRAQLIAAIADFARYHVKDQVHIDHRLITFPIVERKWSFRQGTVIYSITDNKRVIYRVFRTQEQLMAAEALHEAPDSPPAPQLEGYWDLPSDW